MTTRDGYDQTSTVCKAPLLPPGQSEEPPSYPNGNPHAPLNPSAARHTDSCLAPLHGPVEHIYACDGPAPGDIPYRWIHGSVCAARNTDPRIQVLAYNEDTYILRENPCVDWQAPFTYLLFGNRGALLIDTGATADAAHYPLRSTVDAVIRRWCTMRGRTSVPLTVVLTSAESLAQNQGLVQFIGRPGTTLMPTGMQALQRFFALEETWPHGTATIDLGGRILDVIPTPGTHRDGLTLYDRYTCMLHTGDLLYPGRIMIANDRDYAASLERLAHWSQTHPLKWIMGGHVDMMFVPGRAYPRFATYREFEHVMQLEPSILADAAGQSRAIVGTPGVTFRAEYILLNRVGPDEKVYRTSPDMPEVPIPFWLP